MNQGKWILGVVGLLAALGALPLAAQPVISAKSGLIAYVEGKVFVGDQPVESSITRFPEMKENAVLRTEEGRAELLLIPGVVLRLGENSSLKLLGNRLIDTRLEVQSGAAVVEADAIGKDNNVSVVCKDATVALQKAGVYRFDAAPGSLKVFKGEASVQYTDRTVPVGGGRMAMLSGTSAQVEKFNTEETDALDHWSHRRGEALAMANVSAAKTLMDGGGYASYAPYLGVGLAGPGFGLNNCLNAWAFNQWYGMYTYMPCNGYLYSPYGYAFWSPYTVMQGYYAGYYPGGAHYGVYNANRTIARGGMAVGNPAILRGSGRNNIGSGMSGPRGSFGGAAARGGSGGGPVGGGFSRGGGFSGGGGVSGRGGASGGGGGARGGR